MDEIVLDNVAKSYDRRSWAVQATSYAVEKGHFVTLLGPSGCGKTTTLNMIAGLEDVTDGTITIAGRRVDELPPHRRDLAFVFQDYALYPHMTVYANMAFGLRMRKTAADDVDTRVRDAARRLSLEPYLDRKPRDLSGGQRQRVALGRAIARRPAVFLFDEPLSNLDALLRDQTRTELKQLHQELGATSVYVTHDQEEALTLSDKIAVMNEGRLVQYDSPQEIYRAPATEFVATFVGKPRMNMLAASTDGQHVRVSGTPLHFDRGDVRDATLKVGLRPDEIVLTDDRETGATGSVVLVEPLGHATDLVVRVGEQQIVVRTPGFFQGRPGDTVVLDIRSTPKHLFSDDGAKRLAA